MTIPLRWLAVFASSSGFRRPETTGAYAAMRKGKGSYPVSERMADRVLSLPIGPHMDPAQVADVAGALRA